MVEEIQQLNKPLGDPKIKETQLCNISDSLKPVSTGN
jgi:hypothetical protein